MTKRVERRAVIALDAIMDDLMRDDPWTEWYWTDLMEYVNDND